MRVFRNPGFQLALETNAQHHAAADFGKQSVVIPTTMPQSSSLAVECDSRDQNRVDHIVGV